MENKKRFDIKLWLIIALIILNLITLCVLISKDHASSAPLISHLDASYQDGDLKISLLMEELTSNNNYTLTITNASEEDASQRLTCEYGRCEVVFEDIPHCSNQRTYEVFITDASLFGSTTYFMGYLDFNYFNRSYTFARPS